MAKKGKTYSEVNESLEMLQATDVYLKSNGINKYARPVTELAYKFSNEPLFKLYKNFNFIDKSVATVGSSGDQMLSAIYWGAKDVTLIDGNKFTQLVVELKIAGIKNLPYMTFMDYWNSENLLDQKIYPKISHDLSEKSKLFWDTLYLDDTNLENKIFHINNEDFFNGLNSPIYDSEKNFNLMKEALKHCKIEFIIAECLDFPKRLKKKYDFIFLSNIYDYVETDEFYQVVNELYKNNLNPHGKLQYEYMFGKYLFSQSGDEYLGLIKNIDFNGIIRKISCDEVPKQSEYVKKSNLKNRKRLIYTGTAYILNKDDEIE